MSYIGKVPFVATSNNKWSLNGYISTKIGGSGVNLISPSLKLYGIADSTLPSITYAKELTVDDDFFLSNVFAGVTFKRINRISLFNPDNGSEEIVIPILGLITGSGDISYQNGTGYGIDVGLLADKEIFASTNAKVGFVISNLSTTLQGKRYEVVSNDMESYSYHQDIPTIAKVGISWESDFLAKFFPLFGMYQNNSTTKNIETTNNLNVSGNVSANEIDKDFDDNEEDPDFQEDTDIVSENNSTTPDIKIKDDYAKTTYAIDIDIVAPYSSIFKRIHLGLEQPIFSFLALRMGLNQGYPTMGVDINLNNIFHMGMTYFTEELGEEIGDNPLSYYIYDFGFYW